MKHIDKVAIANEKYWQEQVKQGDGHTLPWVDLDLDQLRRYLRGEMGNDRLVGRKEPRRMLNVGQRDISPLGEVKGKDVLCLACGGGQQSAVFALLGAHVTVVDLSQGQLEADRKAAAHYGYDVRTVHADMRDLSALQSESIDIVFEMSSSYVPDIRQVYSEVARVLKIGGLYRTDQGQPATSGIEWNGSAYQLTKAYADRNNDPENPEGTMGFTHYMDDIFNGLVDNGLSLFHVEDLYRGRRPDPDAKPGSYMHQHIYVGGRFVIFARKEGS